MNVGIVGLGAMGFGVAKTLLAEGLSVYGCDVRREATSAFVREGGLSCATPAAMAEECDVLVLFVVNAAQIDEVLFGPTGAASRLPKGAVVISCATVSPSYIRSLAERLNETGHRLIEAPVSGGVQGAAEGKLTLMTAGPDDAFHASNEVLQAMAGKVYRFGPKYGVASKIKTVNQLLVGVHIAAAAEAVALGLREGVEPELLYDVITNSAGNSWAFADRVPRLIKGQFNPPSTMLDIFVKDLSLVLDLAKESRFPLPLASTAYQMFANASSAGFGAEDDIAVIKTYPGIELPNGDSVKS